MNKFIRFYNQNRGLIITIIIIIALILIILQILNSIVTQKQNELKKENNRINQNIQENVIENSNVSTITGQIVQNNENKTNVIKKFVKYCNEGQYENAYNMLTNDCKLLMYPSLERFKTNYVDRIFNIYRMYTLENWYSKAVGDTYYIKYTEDVLATGNANSSNNIGDYITVVNTNDTKCININNYIGSVILDRTQSKMGITVTVNKKYMYMDYTILDVQIKNESTNTICLDTKEDLQSTYIYDENGTKYTALLNENPDSDFVIEANKESNIKIKFNKRYNPESRFLQGLNFKEVILNYDEYISGKYEKNTTNFDINIYI